ncbi:hypothetical protein Tco_0374438 [Tanacetum coccineum]
MAKRAGHRVKKSGIKREEDIQKKKKEGRGGPWTTRNGAIRGAPDHSGGRLLAASQRLPATSRPSPLLNAPPPLPCRATGERTLLPRTRPVLDGPAVLPNGRRRVKTCLQCLNRTAASHKGPSRSSPHCALAEAVTRRPPYTSRLKNTSLDMGSNEVWLTSALCK